VSKGTSSSSSSVISLATAMCSVLPWLLTSDNFATLAGSDKPVHRLLGKQQHLETPRRFLIEQSRSHGCQVTWGQGQNS